MKKQLITEKTVLELTRKLGLDSFDYVIAASYRGIVAAKIAAQVSGAVFVETPIKSFLTASRIKSGEFYGKRILIADDVSVTGRTLEESKTVFAGSKVSTFAIAGKADYSIYEKPFCLELEKSVGKDKGIKLKDFLNKWFYFFLGFIAFVWLIIRSGTNPKRIIYPCQQAAIPIAVTWVAGIVGFLFGGFFIRRYLKVSVIVAALFMSVYAVVNFPHYLFSAVTDPLPTWENINPVSKIYVVDNTPQPIGSLEDGNAGVPDAYLNDGAVDMMVELMDAKGQYFYKTTAHPTGLFGSNDVVIIKGNFQWDYRNGTNTDRIKGVIWKLLNHPNGFTGEIVVADDTQLLWGNPVEGINQQDNNSYFINQSVVDVCNTFKAKGYAVSFRCWAAISNIKVNEYNTGDMNEGYVQTGGLNSENWPKFTTSGGKYVSLRYGVWEGGAYDKGRLSVINFPVLKAHDDFGAVTCATKCWVGMLSCDASFYNADRHNFFWASSHLVARTHIIVREKICFIDAEWVARTGPNKAGDVHSYAGKFIATTDPVAGDWYASSYILAQVANNANNMNGSYVGGNTYNVLNSVATYLNGQGVPATTNAAQMSVYAYRELHLATATVTPTPSNVPALTITASKTIIVTSTKTLTAMPSATMTAIIQTMTSTATFTQVVTVQPTMTIVWENNFTITNAIVYPNPYNPKNEDLKMNILITQAASELKFRIYTAAFRRIMEAECGAQSTKEVTVIIMKDRLKYLSSGIYYIVVIGKSVGGMNAISKPQELIILK
ncbi:MAG: DUF362 domain-containing protein [bacterium]